jgi:hypothetical protein
VEGIYETAHEANVQSACIGARDQRNGYVKNMDATSAQQRQQVRNKGNRMCVDP